MSFRKNINVKKHEFKKHEFKKPEFKSEEKHNEPIEPIEPKEVNLEKGFIFISDINLNKDVKKAFKQFNKNITEYNYNSFHNVKIDDIKLSHIWFNIFDKNTKLYLQRNLKNAINYKKYIISDNLDKTWINDIDQYIDKKIKTSKLKNHLVALSYDDFSKNINSIPISDVPDKLISIFGYIKDKQIKKKVLKIIKSILKDEIPFHLIMLALSSTVPCLLGAVEVIQTIKQSNDIKNIILNAIDKKES